MFETTSEFKKSVKALVKGAIKTKLFGGEANDYVFTVTLGDFDKKEKRGCVCVKIAAGPITMCVGDAVNTRVYNKITDEFFAPLVAQFEKLKSVNTIKFDIATAECTEA